MKTLAALLLASSALLPIAAQAEALPMAAEAGDAGETADHHPIVVTGQVDSYGAATANGTKAPTPLIDVPQSVTVLTREQLDDQGVTQLGDALRYVPGVVLAQGEGNRDQIVLRGQNTTADFFLNGLRDDTQYYRSLYNIDHVEVLRGANALLFGRGGGGGVINRVRKTPSLSGESLGASAAAGTFGDFALAADLNAPLSQTVGARLNGTYEEFDNHRQDFHGRFIGVNPTLAFAPSADTRVDLSYNYDDDRRTADRGVASLGGKPLVGYRDTFFGRKDTNIAAVKAHIVEARLTQQLADSLTLTVAGQYSHTDKYYANIFAGAAVNPADNTVSLSAYNSTVRRESWIGQANLAWQGRTGPIGHTVIAGIEGGDQATDAARSEGVFPGGKASATVTLANRLDIPAITFGAPSRSTHAKVTTLSAYVQDQIELAPFLQIVGGVRYDSFKIAADNLLTDTSAGRTDRKWSPRAGVIVKPRANVSLYGSYTKSFLPQSGDQFSALDAVQATLAPEEFRNLEVGAKWDVTPALALAAAAYRLDRENSRFNDPVTGLPQLSGKTRTRGIELSATGRILPQWQVSLGYALQDGKVRSSTTAAPAGRSLALLPESQISLWTRYDIDAKLGLGLGVTHQSSAYATVSNSVTLPAWTRVDTAVFYTLSKAVSVQLNVNNLLNEQYFPNAHTDNNITTAQPRSARLSVRMAF
ncbi:TonB-dependent receptor [Novosphingobium fuchskuhlense]|uniref:TonB-dependent receptor n=1 Tax=Novosphingobium fuchskuhlense TaxID=1117702 RepID=UPI001F0A522A|nr:TonB-dependent siderophore receptor [Novosphingobium fuchskuhlense]